MESLPILYSLGNDVQFLNELLFERDEVLFVWKLQCTKEWIDPFLDLLFDESMDRPIFRANPLLQWQEKEVCPFTPSQSVSIDQIW